MTARLEGRRLRLEKIKRAKDQTSGRATSSGRRDWWLHYSLPKDVLPIRSPATRSDSARQSIFHLQEGVHNSAEEKLGRRRNSSPRELLRVETHSSLIQQKSLEDSLGDLRAQLNSHPGKKVRERERRNSSLKEYPGYQFPDDITTRRQSTTYSAHNGLLNGSLYIPNGSLLSPSTVKEEESSQRHNGFEFDLEDDISKMAAQRDQQRGSSRYIRGMMAPIISKDDDIRKVGTTRHSSLMKQRSDSVLEVVEDNSRSSSVMDSRRPFKETSKFSDILESKGFKKRLPSENHSEELGSRDIMAQSLMRQTLRGSKPNLLDSHFRPGDSSPSRIKIGTRSSSDFTVLRSDKMRSSSVCEKDEDTPSTHDDIQILNLHGFMDSVMRGQTATVSRQGDNKLKSKRKQLRRLDEFSSVDSTKREGRSRHKKKSKHSKEQRSSSSNDVVLKDIDDLDEKMGSLVVGPKQMYIDSVGRPISFDEAVRLRQILTGSPSVTLPKEWMEQSFLQNKNSNLSYGLVQRKGGPCGVLASVQAHIMKNLIFGSPLSPTTTPASPLRPSTREWAWALTLGITNILWRMSTTSTEQKVILALPGSMAAHFDTGIGRYTRDGLTEMLTLYEFSSEEALLSAIERHLQVFTTDTSSGCVLLLYSALLTRGLETVSVDMDKGGGYLINAHGYASQEVVNLLLTGEATTNTFNGDRTLGGEDNRSQPKLPHSMDVAMVTIDQRRKRESVPSDKLVLRGIHKRSEIGLLSLFEHYGSCKVGSHLKSPEYPVWVVCSESHYSVVFGRDAHITRDELPQEPFDMYFYDGLSLQEDEIRLTLDPRQDPVHADLVPPLELCLRTKWPGIHISWNGTDPIL